MGRDLSDILNKIFSAYFTFEMCVKVMALGFCVGPKTFLSDGANWLDALVVAIGIMDFVPPNPDEEGGGSLSALRALRVLRPLRAVNKFPKLRDLVILLGQCMSKLVTVIGITLFIFLVFGILGVQLYAGAYWVDVVSLQSAVATFPVLLSSVYRLVLFIVFIACDRCTQRTLL